MFGLVDESDARCRRDGSEKGQHTLDTAQVVARAGAAKKDENAHQDIDEDRGDPHCFQSRIDPVE